MTREEAVAHITAIHRFLDRWSGMPAAFRADLSMAFGFMRLRVDEQDRLIDEAREEIAAGKRVAAMFPSLKKKDAV